METCQIEDVIYTATDGIGDFAISSDGWIAYIAYFGHLEGAGWRSDGIAMIVLDDQQQEVLRVDGITNSPNWSRDGEWLAYYVNDEGIKIVRRDGSDTQLIAAGYNPWWSPDGEWLVYWTYKHEIYKINVITKENVLLYSGGSYPTWR
jgi:hypothetical protein